MVTKKKALSKTKPRKKKAKPAVEKEGYHLPARTEAEQLEGLSEELMDAWRAIRRTLSRFGAQRIYTSHRSIMFARKTCYAFVRPKRKFLELNFFLLEALDSPLIKKVSAVSKTKSVHVVHVVHSEQVEEPLTDWLAQAYREAGASG